MPHWAHRFRNNQKRTPLQVLGTAQGKYVEPVSLQNAFGQRYCQRRIDEYGFIKMGRWKIYVEEGLPKTAVQLSYWDGKLRADYGEQRLIEYQCRWGANDVRPAAIYHPTAHLPPVKPSRKIYLTRCGYAIRSRLATCFPPKQKRLHHNTHNCACTLGRN